MTGLKKRYDTPEALLADIEEMSKVGGLMLEAKERATERETTKIQLMVGGKNQGEFDAEVVYCAEGPQGFQVGLELRGAWQEALQQTKDRVDSQGKPRSKWGRDSESLFHTIAKMTPHEKIQLALKGGRQERRVLLKDSHYMVHPYVLKNPKISTEEVGQIARMHTLTGEMIHAIAGNAEWMQNNMVRLAIVKNPKTPLNIVQKHMKRVRDHDLVQIAKSEGVRDAVSKAAKRILASRGRVVR